MTLKPYYESGGITIYHGDCREILPTLNADHVITDPPYGTGWNRGGGNAPNGGPHPYRRRRESAPWDVFDLGWMDLIGVPLAAFCPTGRVWEMCAKIATPCILRYRKTNPAPYGAKVEPIVCSRQPFGGSWEFATYNGDNTLHPCQKPLPLMVWLVTVMTLGPGCVVLDPFMGSGTTLLAAKNLGRKAMGIEIEEKYCEIAARRLDQEVLELGAGEPAAFSVHPAQTVDEGRAQQFEHEAAQRPATGAVGSLGSPQSLRR